MLKTRSRMSAILLSLALAVTSIPAAGMTAKAASTPEECNLLARYPLQEDTNDISGNGKNGEVHGYVTYDDGMVLPGGKNTSAADASYVTLPGNLFAGKENLTISVWIKNASNKGNYAALFFGTPAQTNKMPLNYWLFNPINPDSRFKSVFTNSNNTDKPYSSETGVVAGEMEQYKNKWAHYTTVLTENSVTGYVNGKKIGSVSKTKKVTDFGAELQAYIGRSNYLDDTTYAGSFQDLQIYEGAMSGEQVQEVYFDTEHISQNVQESLLPDIAAQLSLDGQTENGVVMEAKKLELPSESHGASIQWSSDKESVISKEGQVTLPTEKTTVTLTASLKLGKASSTKNFVITVLPADQKLAYVKENLRVPYVLDNGVVLPNKAGDVTISWSGSSAVKSDGSIAADFNGKQEIELKATLSYDKQTEEKSFHGWLLGKDAGYVESYTRTPSGDCVDKLARSMFLAYSDNGKDGFSALHDDYGVLFMRAESKENEQLTAKSLKDPYLFYTKDGKYGVAVVRTEEKGAKDATKASSVMFYTSEDLLNYDEVGFVDLKTDLAVNEPVCEYDSSIDAYRITWNDGAGNYYQNTISEISAASQASAPTKAPVTSIRKAELGLSGAKASNLLPLENVKGTRLKNKLSKLVNTGMEVPESVTAASAEDVQDVRATALYNDGSTASKKVNWDLSSVDFEKPGAYTVNGTVTQPTFNNSKPLFQARPDPEMVKYNGKFYFISTDENGQGRIYIRQSDTLEGIKESSETLLLDGKSYPQLFTACLWAPELHVIEGKLYLFFSGSLSNWAGVQSHVMWLKEGGDPMKTADWETPVRVLDKDGKNLYDTDTQGITLDMTYFQVENQGYVVWAQRQRKPVDTGSWLYIAKVDKAKPWQLTSDRVCISKPDYGWDNNTTFVDEGPFVIQRNGKIYLTFSGAGVNPSYCVGIITASADTDLLSAASWKKGNYPILTSWSVPGQYGTGHNSYVYDDDGTLYNVYHAQWNKGQRSASIRRVHFDIDGEPVLDLVEERDLLDQYKSVTMQVQVVEKPAIKDDGKGNYEVTIPNYTPGQNENITILLPDSLADSMKNSQGTQVSINVKLPEGLADDKVEAITIPKEVLDAAKEAGKDLTVTVTGSTSYQWTFSAKDLADANLSDLNLTLEVDSEKDAELKNLLGKDETGMVLSFAQQGDIPGAKVTVDVAKMGWKAGETVTLSYYNPETKKLETAGTYKVDKDGKIAIAPAKGGKYVLWQKTSSEPEPVIPVEKITLNKTKLTLNVKKTYQLEATVTPKDATNNKVTWNSDNQGVATVSATGLVKANKAGTAKITAKAGGKSITCTVTVKVPVSKVTLNKTKLTMGVKETFTLKATVKPKNATSKKVSWKTKNKKIVTVKNGKLTAKKKGNTTITATVGGKKVTCKVTVKPAPTKKAKVTLNKKKVSLKVKKTFQIKPKVSSKFGSATFKYTIDKKGKKAVKVDKNGKVTAKKKGKATITVKTYNGKAKVTLKVTVK